MRIHRTAAVALSALILLLSGCGGQKATLVVYCAGGLRVPVEAAAQEYEAAYGVRIELHYGGSETLLNNAAIRKEGDLYIPGDDDYLKRARERHLLAETIPLAEMHPVLAVRKDSTWAITSLNRLPKDLRLGLANPDAAAVGRLTRKALGDDAYDRLAQRGLGNKGTVNEVANDLKIGALDAAVLWDATVTQMPDLKALDVPELHGVSASISVGVLRSSQQPTAALRFARFLASSDCGLPHFTRNGYQAVQGDSWAETPELQVMCGAMLRPAVEQTLDEFEQREGVKLTRVYNGCGVLVAQMRTSGAPDVFFACDSCFVPKADDPQLGDRFLAPVTISNNDVVIAVPHGNPRGIEKLSDLAQKDLKVGVGHPQQSALGVLTARLLNNAGLSDAIRPNIDVESATGDFLINQLRTGALDAVLVYRSNARSGGDQLQAIELGLPGARAEQPFVIGSGTRYPRLARRLLETVSSSESQQRFLNAGFGWVAR